MRIWNNFWLKKNFQRFSTIMENDKKNFFFHILADNKITNI